MAKEPMFSKILLKVSGESLMGEQQFGIDSIAVGRICDDIADAMDTGCRLAIAIGGGNIFRGVNLAGDGKNRVTADHMGMLATVMNGLALKMALRDRNCDCVVMSATAIPSMCETFTQEGMENHLRAGKVIIFVAGIGSPYFTSDTVSALRALEMGADAIFKATQVDGIYSEDPKKNPNAEKFDLISHKEVLDRGLQVMDVAAVSLAQTKNLPIIVFSIHTKGGLKAILEGGGIYTRVQG